MELPPSSEARSGAQSACCGKQSSSNIWRQQEIIGKHQTYLLVAYSFGVVLFEIICARPALDTTLADEEWNLADWAKKCHQKGVHDQIMDPYLKGKIALECLKTYTETALKCVSNRGIERPSMGEVRWNLEFALHLQESGKMDIQEGSSSTGVLSDHGSKRRLKTSDLFVSCLLLE
ncbi:hypothetical protein EZV62_015613 [Acer yangbiense]|uniref:Serine-threonine/tyrosine-protein kinase catalytic domain-containing protein n=1 Tax=Acer yangbiense TaxID=1000413 RepID=A0A5C7HLM0_9ROSI|nr:hypothetical protein EZV62_015613 [Acer yangbiense]